jgi:hypothetical protein
MYTHPLLEQLIDAQLDFLDQHFAKSTVVEQEFLGFYQWFRKQNLADLWSFQDIYQLLQQQILNTQASQSLITQIAEQLRFFLVHPSNEHSQIQAVISVLTVDKLAQYVASKRGHRERLIKTVVNNQAFSAMLSQLIQHAIQDYLDNSVVKNVPGVSQFMKMGRSVLESVTDQDLDNTIQQYLQRNILKLSQMSENVLNQHFDDDKLYHFQAGLWHKIKTKPLSVLRNYIEVQDLPQTVSLGHEVWDHMRQTDYLKQQLHDGLYAWYSRNQQHNFDTLLRDLNIDESLIAKEINALLQPVVSKMIASGYLRERSRAVLREFYYSEKAQQILTLQ